MSSNQATGSNYWSGEGGAVDAEGSQATGAQQPSSSRPTSAASASRTLLWSASARRPPSAAHDRQSTAAPVGSHPPSASRPGSARVRPGSASDGSAHVRPGSGSNGGARPGSASRVRPASADEGGSRPDSALGGGGLGGGRGRRNANSIPGSSTGAQAQDPVEGLSQPTWLREEVEHKKAEAAARLAQQRAQQAALSDAIRALRQGVGGEAQGQTMAELRSNLTLRAAVEAGPGAAGEG
uniref:Uncharacterized protein n=1 Tax=Dunaliella tertiolecta TaxID=3047 RepID=A0A7S3QLV6_DUNTE